MPARDLPLVHVILLPSALPAPLVKHCHSLLDADENGRAAVFKLEPARERFMAARVLLRQTLSTVRPVPPADWRYARGPQGKPFVTHPADASTLAFSLSHTAGAIAVAVSQKGDIGVDVQAVDRPVELSAFRACLAADETAALAALPAGTQTDAFYDLWAAKEAVVKAVGTGVSDAMAGLRVVTDDRGTRSVCADARFTGWHVTRRVLPTGARLAVATRDSRDIRLEVRTLTEWLTSLGTI